MPWLVSYRWLEKCPFFVLLCEEKSYSGNLIYNFKEYICLRVSFPNIMSNWTIVSFKRWRLHQEHSQWEHTHDWLTDCNTFQTREYEIFKKTPNHHYKAKLFRIIKISTYYLITTRAERFSISFLEDVCKFLQFLFNTGKILKAMFSFNTLSKE